MFVKAVLVAVLFLSIASVAMSAVAVARSGNSSSSDSLLTKAGQCTNAKYQQQLFQNADYRKAWVSAYSATTAAFRHDLTQTAIDSASQTAFDGDLASDAAEVSFWCG